MDERELVEVYRAKDILQAHLLQAALEDAGIEATVEGDLLQGAAGGVPPGWSTAPRIKVERCNAPRAREILARREKARAVEAKESLAAASGGTDDGVCLVCGAPMGEEDEACAACGWSYTDDEAAER